MCPKHGFAAQSDDPKINVTFINVGYGDSILIRHSDGMNILIDAGESHSTEQIIERLQNKKVERIQHAFMTHVHDNHYGGFQNLLSRIPIDWFYVNGDEKNFDQQYAHLLGKIEAKGIPVQVLRQDEELRLAEDLQFKILHPRSIQGSPNANSLVSWLKFKDVSFLFTGDMLPKDQEKIMIQYPFIHESACVQLPHHGGQLSETFAKGFPLAVFVVPTGENEYGMPMKEELNKVQGKILRTDKRGDIDFVTDGITLILN